MFENFLSRSPVDVFKVKMIFVGKKRKARVSGGSKKLSEFIFYLLENIFGYFESVDRWSLNRWSRVGGGNVGGRIGEVENLFDYFGVSS